MAKEANLAEIQTAGIAKHPKYYGVKVTSQMRLPGDTRLFRDIKVHEIPQWLMKRDFSPLGLWFTGKRIRHGFMSKYVHVRKPAGIWIAQVVAICTIVNYMGEYDLLKRTEMKRKYH